MTIKCKHCEYVFCDDIELLNIDHTEGDLELLHHLPFIEEETGEIRCPVCGGLRMRNVTGENDKQKFESFCKENDLEYNFETSGEYYKNSETNKAFAIYKYSDDRRKK